MHRLPLSPSPPTTMFECETRALEFARIRAHLYGTDNEICLLVVESPGWSNASKWRIQARRMARRAQIQKAELRMNCVTFYLLLYSHLPMQYLQLSRLTLPAFWMRFELTRVKNSFFFVNFLPIQTQKRSCWFNLTIVSRENVAHRNRENLRSVVTDCARTKGW